MTAFYIKKLWLAYETTCFGVNEQIEYLMFVFVNAWLLLKWSTKNSPSLQIVVPLKFRLHTSSFSLKTYRAEKLIFKGTKCSLGKRRGVGHAIMKVFLSTRTQPVRFARCS